MLVPLFFPFGTTYDHVTRYWRSGKETNAFEFCSYE